MKSVASNLQLDVGSASARPLTELVPADCRAALIRQRNEACKLIAVTLQQMTKTAKEQAEKITELEKNATQYRSVE